MPQSGSQAIASPAPRRHRGLKFYLAVTAGILGLGVAVGAVLASGPDRELTFVREVPVEASPEALEKSMWALVNWPRWFFQTDKVERVDLLGRPFPMIEQTLAPGAWLDFHMNKKKGLHPRFNLRFKVTEWVPGRKVSLTLLEDSTGRIKRLFDRLDWTIEILPAVDGAPLRVRGTETAHTAHWRSRLFGVLAERIMMNQVFYPDLIQLGTITQPLSLNPRPVYEQ